jgi:hypothetical protein
MKSKSKFLKICESTLTRLERNGFLVGDVVEISDINKVPENARDELQSFLDQGLNLKVVDIVNKYPSDKPGSEQNNTGDVVLMIAADYGGGRFVGKMPLPCDCCKVVDSYPNLDPIPDALRRDNQITIKPEPVSDEEEEFMNQTNKADDGSGELQRVADKNSTGENINQPGPTPPEYAPYTGKYMQ